MNNSYYEGMSAEQAIRELAAMGIAFTAPVVGQPQVAKA